MKRALVLISGGMDSSVCLAWALARYDTVETIGFNYGQSYAVEMVCRERIIPKIASLNPEWASHLGQDHRFDLAVFQDIAASPMTLSAAAAMQADKMLPTFVAGRNLQFFTVAAAVAYRRDITHLVGGMLQGGGTPDCRDDTLKALQVAINLGTLRGFVIETPLMWTDKAGIWRMAAELGGTALVDLIREESHSCYLGDREHRHDWGYGCGSCPTCEDRAVGWQQYLSQSNQRLIRAA